MSIGVLGAGKKEGSLTLFICTYYPLCNDTKLVGKSKFPFDGRIVRDTVDVDNTIPCTYLHLKPVYD